MVRIVIVGGEGSEFIDYSDGANTRAVKDDLLGGFGRGILKLNGTGFLKETLEEGEYTYHLTAQAAVSVPAPPAAAEMITPDTRRKKYDVTKALLLASKTSCRQIIEDFKNDFVKTHRQMCGVNLNQATTTDVLLHFESCKAVNSSGNPLGDALTCKLISQDTQAPSAGSFLGSFKALSESIHAQDWMRDSAGDIIVPYDLDAPQKRLIVRYLRASGRSVVIADFDGSLRDPNEDEIESPPNVKKVKLNFN